MINYNEDEKALIYLSQFDFMTSAKFGQLLEYFPNPSQVFSVSPKELFVLKDVLKKNYEVFLDAIVNYNSNQFFGELNKRNIKAITIFSNNYSNSLLNLKNPPYVLFYVGDIELLNQKSVAIVGTRSPSSYGKQITEKYSRELSRAGVCVVSGLATGVDKIAHEFALEENGKTIAVLGGGFDHIFPAANINLAREIGKRGLIITEYFPKIAPTKYTFPYRNRIIAALSSAILITEAGIKSGSLYTKEYADDLGIETYAVPGNITSQKSSATNMLIKSGQAMCTTSPDDILMSLGFSAEKKEKKQGLQLNSEQAIIYELLKDGEKNFEFLQENTNFSTQILSFNLTTMEISGIIRKLAGNAYVLAE